MAKQQKKAKPAASPKPEKVEETPKAAPKVVKSESVSKPAKVDKDGLQEATLIEDHGFKKKGEKVRKHPNMIALLIKQGIAK